MMADDLYQPGPYAPMALAYDEDPKVAALVRFGEDAGLCRDLHLAMIRYSNRAHTDGLVPGPEALRLAWPLPPHRTEEITAHLAEVELIAPAMGGANGDSLAGAMPVAWRVINWEKWNRTKAWLEAQSARKSEAGKKGAETRWTQGKRRRRSRDSAGETRSMAPAMAGAMQELSTSDGTTYGTAMATRTSTGTDKPSSSPDRHPDARARGRAREDDDDSAPDELTNTIVALLHAHGPITRDQAAAYRERVLAGRNVEDPARYVIGAIRRDPQGAYREAVQSGPSTGKGQPPPPSMICRRCGAIGDHREADCTKAPPSDDSAKHGAAAARAGLANRPRGAQAAALGEDSTDPTRAGLHGEELARAQLAASRLGGSIIGVEPAPPQTTDPGPAEPEEGDEEYVPPF
jgi:hypothetical protein